MQVKETNIKLRIAYNDSFTHRYSITKTWDNKKTKALIIMKNPSSSELLESDLTTMLVINNLAKLDYGSVIVCNLMSTIQAPYNCDTTSKEHKENFEEILKQAKGVDYIIIGWGSYGVGNVKAQSLQSELLEKLLPYKDKIMYIANPRNPKSPVHPLFPQVRSNWLLKPYSDIVELTSKETKEEVKAEVKQETKEEKI